MWLLSAAAWLLLASVGFSDAYSLSVNLKSAEIDPLNLSPEDSIEDFFDGIDRPSTSILEGTSRLLPALETVDSDPPGSNQGIAGRISLPGRNLLHPTVGYHGAPSRRISEILGEAADIPLVRTASGRSQASSQQRAEGDVVVITNDVPPNSRGRCFEFEVPEGEFNLQSIILSQFSKEDEVPIGLSFFTAPGCRKNRGFIWYLELDRTPEAEEYKMDLESLRQSLSNQFSILPVYGVSDSETPLYLTSDEDVNEAIGTRPSAPLLEIPDEIDLRDGTVEDYLQEFNVPWAVLSNTNPQNERVYEEEEKREVTPPSAVRRNRPSPWYLNPSLPAVDFPGFEITSSSPRHWNAIVPDSDDEIDSAHVASRGDRGDSDIVVTNVNNNQAGTPAHVALDIGDFALGDDDDDGFNNDPDVIQIGDEVFIRGYPDPWLWELNAHPETAGLDPWQYPENRGEASSEDKGLG
ncbi:hypothetical protein TWF718_007785 [Orbilia javanica]|uniref:Uncharacterized protein n=1 Tax=Orbilia javanica TaxID=47235 RepID=A0AAN8MVT7_9PEZI